MSEELFKSVAQQLRQPHGEHASKTAERMNEGNRPMYEFTLKRLQPEPGNAILEIGMGNGLFTRDVVSLTDNLVYRGCDFSEPMVLESRERNKDLVDAGKASFHYAEASSMPFEDAAFDRIFSINTLYFWEDPAPELEEIKRVLRPAGRLLIAIRPAELMVHYPFTRYGFKLYTEQELREVLEKNNFRVLELVREQEPDFELDGKMVGAATLVAVAEPIN